MRPTPRSDRADRDAVAPPRATLRRRPYVLPTTSGGARRHRRGRTRGFTLVELTVAIVLLGVVALMVTNFATGAMQSYLDAQRRAGLVDSLETAMRRLQRDLRMALPNSVRVTSAGSTVYLEFIPALAGGRYRAEAAGGSPSSGGCGVGANNPLAFGVADSAFSTLGPVPDLPAPAVNPPMFVVVYNLGAGFAGADAYAGGSATGGNKALYRGTANSACESTVTIAAHAFTLPSPAARFHLVRGPVTYACDTATGRLDLYPGYAISAAQPTPPAVAPALVLDGITGCDIVYNPNAVSQRLGVVSVTLTRSLGGESVRLYHEISVDNAP